MVIPFHKAHGARNDFLLTWRERLPAEAGDPASIARRICDRHTGVGADGWILMSAAAGSSAQACIELWNSDGSRSEISGNGTRCAAALIVKEGFPGQTVRIQTGAGEKSLRLLERNGLSFSFEMNMGRPVFEDLDADLVPRRTCVLLNIGNPQCAVFVDDFDFDWAAEGARLERHPRFPDRTNVSFIRVLDRHNLKVHFFERGAGVTMSSGTGSTGAVAAAIVKGLAESPVEVHTPAGPLQVRVDGNNAGSDFFLSGPAEIVTAGEYYLGA